jgi:tyrosine-protein phosphatase SIW14
MARFLKILLPFILVTTAAHAAKVENLPNYAQVTENIYRGGRPTSAGISQLKAQGIKTIIDIENNMPIVHQEENLVTKSGGMKFVSSPMDWQTTPDDGQIDSLLKMLTDAQNFPIYLHCRHGEDRTGLVIGLYRVLVQSWNADDAYKEMVNLGFHPKYKALVDYYRQKTK